MNTQQTQLSPTETKQVSGGFTQSSVAYPRGPFYVPKNSREALLSSLLTPPNITMSTKETGGIHNEMMF